MTVAGGPDSAAQVAEIAAGVLRYRRYAWLSPQLVERLAATEIARARNAADAVKRTKRRLHQVFGAYVLEVRPDVWLRELREALAAGEPESLRVVCRRLMSQHASTRERLAVLDQFYAQVFAITGPPSHLADLACGLGPLALPWMNLPPGASIFACDVDRRIVALVDGFLAACGVSHEVTLCDLAQGAPSRGADVCLLLKTLPCLEQQAPGVSRRLLGSLNSRHVVVSFPTRSLGGAAKGMMSHYERFLETLLDGLPYEPHRVSFPLETVYVLRRTQPAADA